MTTAELMAKLTSDGVCGGRNYPGRSTPNPAIPYSEYDKYPGPVSTGVEGDAGTRCRYDFTCWCSTWDDADQLIKDFRASLQDVGRMEGTPFIGPDPDDDSLWRIINLSFIIIE